MTERHTQVDRYLAYCDAHGFYEPDDMRAHDRERFPGGAMCGYVLWIGQHWREWGELIGGLPHRKSKEDHARFDAWLRSKYPAPINSGGQ